ncbi:MAG: preprotein translocase subunit SecG [Chloroflexi bacterium]|nr:preprotein translocase subunit SecG [Chloroflexota bacterium]
MQTSLAIAEILVAVFLVIFILLQVRGQGSGLFSQGEATFRSRRGVELLTFRFTIFFAALFLLIALLSVRFFGRA